MNCQNAQSMVLNFINNKLDKEETKEFRKHIHGLRLLGGTGNLLCYADRFKTA